MEIILGSFALASILFLILSILNGINLIMHFIIYDNKIKKIINTEGFLEKEEELFKIVDEKYESFSGSFLLMGISATVFYVLKYIGF